jgi:endonuclease/exonuclease/phosphatase family metal-dependent hydrolase
MTAATIESDQPDNVVTVTSSKWNGIVQSMEDALGEVKTTSGRSKDCQHHFYSSVVPRLEELLHAAQELSASFAVGKCGFENGEEAQDHDRECNVLSEDVQRTEKIDGDHNDEDAWILVGDGEQDTASCEVMDSREILHPQKADDSHDKEAFPHTTICHVPSTEHLMFPEDLPPTTTLDSLSVMSYNVLLPNSSDNNGWHIFKSYYPPVASPTGQEFVALWEYRKNLIRKKIENFGRPDVLCFQEVAPDTFQEDFDFLSTELGYDGVALYRKGRMRPATFWKTSKCTLIGEPIHKDRCLLTCFKLNNNSGKGSNAISTKTRANGESQQSPFWHIMNCHLSAGPNGPRRLRQVHDGLTAVVKLERKLQLALNNTEAPPKPKGGNKQSNNGDIIRVEPNVIVCGDFNGDESCAAVRYIKDGSVSDKFVEHGDIVSSKGKMIPKEIGPMMDVVLQANKGDLEAVPPTLVVPEFITFMVDQKEEDDSHPQMSQSVIRRLVNIYNSFATSADGLMTRADVKRWLMKINGRTREGSEFLAAAKYMGWHSPQDEHGSGLEPCNTLPADGRLTLEGFMSIYEEELRQGLYWSIAHDLAVLGKPIVPVENPETLALYQGRFDRMYCSPSTLHPTCVVSAYCDKPCPNDVEPSDHLPIAASFLLK